MSAWRLNTNRADVDPGYMSLVDIYALDVEPFRTGFTGAKSVRSHVDGGKKAYHCIIKWPSDEVELQIQRVLLLLPRLSRSVLGVIASGSVIVVGDALKFP